MFRSLITLALSLFLLAEAGAQTAPAPAAKAKAKSTKAVVRANRRAVKKARVAAVKKAPVAPTVDSEGWPLLEEPQTAVASAQAVNADVYVAAAGSRGELDNSNVYAAPGMPVHIRTSKTMAPYSVRPARKAAGTQTTLGTGN